MANNTAPIDESQLIRSARDGDVNAFNCLVLNYQELVYNVCYRMLGNPDSAADAAQDSFLAAFGGLHGFRGGSFKSWLLRIVANTCYDQLRVRQRRPATSLDGLLEATQDHGLVASDRPGPEELALRRELWDQLQRGMETLPPDQRIVVILGDVQGLSYEEISTATGVGLGTVKSRLSRGREHMRRFVMSHRELFGVELRHNDARGVSR